MNKKGQVGAVAGVVGEKLGAAAGSPVFQWLIGVIVAVVAMYWMFQTNPTAKAFMIFIAAILFFVLVNVIFIYFWYFVGKWIYVIIVNAKSFIQKAVGWILNIFE